MYLSVLTNGLNYTSIEFNISNMDKYNFSTN